MLQIEFEVIFWPVDHKAIRARLRELGATEVRKEYTQERYNFYTPKNTPREWVRVRTDGPRTTLALKRREEVGLQGQRQIEIDVLDFEGTVELLRETGLKEMAYQVAKREIWHLEGCDVDFDTWPHLEPLLKIEGISEASIKNCAEKLGLNWSEARYQTVADLYQEKYGTEDGGLVVEKASRITFDDPNPFV
jgi:adenylate cyclase, class 2